MTLEAIEQDLPRRLERLRRDIALGRHQPGPYRLVRFRSSGDGKEREILHLNLEDKWVQRAAHDYLSERVEPHLADSCMAYRKNRGVSAALERVREWIRKGRTHFLRTDIAAYYPSIRPYILRFRLEQILGGHPILPWTDRLLAAPVLDNRDRPVSVPGLPLGLPLSPLFANLYLAPVDHWMEELNPSYLRFGDDILVLGHSPAELHDLHRRLAHALDGLGLTLKREKTRLGVVADGLLYLGALLKDGVIYQKQAKDGEAPEQGQKSLERSDEPPSGDRTAERHRKALSHALCEVGTCGDLMSVLAEELIEFDEERPEHQTSDLLQCGHRVFLRTLYLTQPGFSVQVHNENVVVKGPETEESIPLRKIHQIVVLGRVHLSTPLLTTCLKHAIPVVFLSHKGHYGGRLESLRSRSGALAYEQWKRADDEAFRLAMAQSIVRGKLRGSLSFLRSRREKSPTCIQNMGVLERLEQEAPTFTAMNEILGHEGYLTRVYFEAYGSLFKGPLSFAGRNRRPPKDPVNALLSFGYTLLYNDLRAVIAAHGLDDRIGFFHTSHSGRPALAMDLIEELRAPVVDRMVLRIANQQILGIEDFDIPEDPEKGTYLKWESRKRFIEEYEKAMRTRYHHGATGLKLDVRRILSLQVICIKKVIQGKLQRYIPAELK